MIIPGMISQPHLLVSVINLALFKEKLLESLPRWEHGMKRCVREKDQCPHHDMSLFSPKASDTPSALTYFH